MKILKNIFKAFRWIVAILVVLFALATFLGESYGKTVTLVLIAVILVYWPVSLSVRIGNKASVILRILSIVVLTGLLQWVFVSPPKTTIYRSDESRQELMELYDICMSDWPVNTQEYDIETEYGKVHVLECGKKGNPPLVMFHAASMGAHSWAENLEPLISHFHIFSFDNPGEGNKSELADALVFPSSPQEVATMYKQLLDKLDIDSAVVFGASNGGFIAQNLAYFYPEKVSEMVFQFAGNYSGVSTNF